MLKKPARSVPRERVVMRFSSNEGQNTLPDVILIPIKEGLGRRELESILLNTINPFFPIWRRTWSERRGYKHLVLEALGDPWQVIKEKGGPERSLLIPPLTSAGAVEVGRGSVLPLVTLEMIACPEGRAGSSAQDFVK